MFPPTLILPLKGGGDLTRPDPGSVRATVRSGNAPYESSLTFESAICHLLSRLFSEPSLDDDFAFGEETNRLLALGMQDSKKGIFHPAEWE